MANINDAADGFLGGKAQFEEWKIVFEQEWSGIDIEDEALAYIAANLAAMDPEMRANLREMDPVAFDTVIDMLEEKEKEDADNIPGQPTRRIQEATAEVPRSLLSQRTVPGERGA